MSQTLIDIINEIRPRKNNNAKNSLSLRSEPYSEGFRVQQSKINQDEFNHQWTLEQNKIFYDFVDTYGVDFSLIQAELPKKTRKQIRKKFDKAEATRRRHQIVRKRLEKLRKTTLFQEHVLELPISEVEQQNNNPKPNTHIN